MKAKFIIINYTYIKSEPLMFNVSAVDNNNNQFDDNVHTLDKLPLGLMLTFWLIEMSNKDTKFWINIKCDFEVDPSPLIKQLSMQGISEHQIVNIHHRESEITMNYIKESFI